MSQTATRERSSLDEFSASVQDSDTGTVPAIEPHMLAVLNRSEIDAQLAVADHKPRNLKAFRKTIVDIATVSEDGASECIYVLPGRKKKDGSKGEDIEGPSIRWTEIMVYGFGNCRAGSRVIDETHDSVVAQGVFCDLQNNVVHTAEVRRRIVDSRGRRYSPDMVVVTANAACSIAKRNAILQGIPKPLWQDLLFGQVRRFALGLDDTAGAQRRIASAIEAFTKQGVAEERILAKLGVAARAEIGIDELAKLRGFFTAIRDGETTVAEVFPAKEPEPNERSMLDQFTAQRGEGSGGGPPPTQASAPAATKSTATDEAQAAVDLIEYRHCIDALIKVAIDKHVPELHERLEILDGALPLWTDKLGDPEFVDKAGKIAARLAKGDITDAQARRYMEALVP